MKPKTVHMYSVLVGLKDNIYQDYFAGSTDPETGAQIEEQRTAYFERSQVIEVHVHSVSENGKSELLRVMHKAQYGLVDFHPDQWSWFKVMLVTGQPVHFSDPYWVHIWTQNNGGRSKLAGG